MNIYAIGKKEDITYAHGMYGTEIHICPINPLKSDSVYHPLFFDKGDAGNYIKELGLENSLFVVEMCVFKKATVEKNISCAMGYDKSDCGAFHLRNGCEKCDFYSVVFDSAVFDCVFKDSCVSASTSMCTSKCKLYH